ncbi:hypothetical protein E6R60_06280 [Streptomyces sp. A0642]|uniref:hypothetical protein n=1 Tax=Streptomyces sp. A0642 TaxID=2563100 RepID=UPI0010A20843|nr:hypothetical protein [Streptomyces sp. A0642]THA78479.1 hypothetical protein E6R60_06280 [Streptomyces sp. A0642]
MSLLVHTYVRGASGTRYFLDDPDDNLAGFEKSRTKLWGSQAARDLGARFFPQLAASDLYVEPEDARAFLAECDLLGDHLAELGEHSGYGADYVQARLANIREAAVRAVDVGGGVIVW